MSGLLMITAEAGAAEAWNRMTADQREMLLEQMGATKFTEGVPLSELARTGEFCLLNETLREHLLYAYDMNREVHGFDPNVYKRVVKNLRRRG